MEITGTFQSGGTVSLLVVAFTSSAPATQSAAGMTIIPTSGPLIGRPVRVKSMVDNGDSTYNVTLIQDLPATAMIPANGNLFKMGFVDDQIDNQVR